MRHKGREEVARIMDGVTAIFSVEESVSLCQGWLRNYPRTEPKALSLHKLEERRSRPGGPSHDSDPTEAQGEADRQTQAVGDHLGSARSPLEACPAHPPRVLADQAHRPPPRQLAPCAQRHYLPHAFGLPV